MGARIHFPTSREVTRFGDRLDRIGAWLLIALFWLAAGVAALVAGFFTLLLLMHMIF